MVLSALYTYPPRIHSQVSCPPPPFGSPVKRVSVQGFPFRQAPCKPRRFLCVGTRAANTLGIPYPRSARNAMHYAVFTALDCCTRESRTHAQHLSVPSVRWCFARYPTIACIPTDCMPVSTLCSLYDLLSMPHRTSQNLCLTLIAVHHLNFTLLSTPYRTFATHVCSMP